MGNGSFNASPSDSTGVKWSWRRIKEREQKWPVMKELVLSPYWRRKWVGDCNSREPGLGYQTIMSIFLWFCSVGMPEMAEAIWLKIKKQFTHEEMWTGFMRELFNFQSAPSSEKWRQIREEHITFTVKAVPWLIYDGYRPLSGLGLHGCIYDDFHFHWSACFSCPLQWRGETGTFPVHLSSAWLWKEVGKDTSSFCLHWCDAAEGGPWWCAPKGEWVGERRHVAGRFLWSGPN